jgi:hypothetical protein
VVARTQYSSGEDAVERKQSRGHSRIAERIQEEKTVERKQSRGSSRIAERIQEEETVERRQLTTEPFVVQHFGTIKIILIDHFKIITPLLRRHYSVSLRRARWAHIAFGQGRKFNQNWTKIAQKGLFWTSFD